MLLLMVLKDHGELWTDVWPESLVLTPRSGSRDSRAPSSSFSRFYSRTQGSGSLRGPFLTPPRGEEESQSAQLLAWPLPPPRRAERVCESSNRNQVVGGSWRVWGAGVQGLTEGSRHRSRGQETAQVWSRGGTVGMVFQRPNIEALHLGCQGRAGPWFPGLGHKNLVQVSTRRILELVEVIWESGDSQFGGSQGVRKDSCEWGPPALGAGMDGDF